MGLKGKRMKGKTKKKKLMKILILAACFVLTIVVSASVTLAWFYDSDWASNGLTMAGAVGIEMRNADGQLTSGAGNLHFKIATNYAYPGQAMDIQAHVYNNGGSSVINSINGKDAFWTWDETNKKYNQVITDAEIEAAAEAGKGSPCYVRAQFVVLTNIDKSAYVADPLLSPEEAAAEQAANALFNSQAIYNALNALITKNNEASDDYDWIYDKNSATEVKFDSGTYPISDNGYFYLCENGTNTLHALEVGEESAFLFENTFVIPWGLTNYTADKEIYIGVTFQAIQTFIPRLTGSATNWDIYATDLNNQADDDRSTAGFQNYYYSTNVQIVFNTSRFSKIKFNLPNSKIYTVGGTNDSDVTAAYSLVVAPNTTVTSKIDMTTQGDTGPATP